VLVINEGDINNQTCCFKGLNKLHLVARLNVYNDNIFLQEFLII